MRRVVHYQKGFNASLACGKTNGWMSLHTSRIFKEVTCGTCKSQLLKLAKRILKDVKQ